MGVLSKEDIEIFKKMLTMTGDTGILIDLFDTIESQQQEIEELQDKFKKTEGYAKKWAGECIEKDTALQQAREALELECNSCSSNSGEICPDETGTLCNIGTAITAIKALGGKE